jgi:hypothetical protein
LQLLPCGHRHLHFPCHVSVSISTAHPRPPRILPGLHCPLHSGADPVASCCHTHRKGCSLGLAPSAGRETG